MKIGMIGNDFGSASRLLECDDVERLVYDIIM